MQHTPTSSAALAAVPADDWRGRRVWHAAPSSSVATAGPAGTVVQPTMGEVHEFLGLHKNCTCLGGHVRVVWDDGSRTWQRRQNLTPCGPEDPEGARPTARLTITVDAALWAAVRSLTCPSAVDDLASFLRVQVESELVGPLHPAVLAAAVVVEHAPAGSAATMRPRRFLCDACFELVYGGDRCATCEDDCPQGLDHTGTCDPAAHDDAACQRCGSVDRLHAAQGWIDGPGDEDGLRAHLPLAVGGVQIVAVVEVHPGCAATGAPASALVIGRHDALNGRYSSYVLHHQPERNAPWVLGRVGHWARSKDEALLTAHAAFEATRDTHALGLGLLAQPVTRKP